MAPKDQLPSQDVETLRSTWRTLYATTLPQLARSKDPAQPKWPVSLDHCFARIILDNTVGNGKQQWDKVIAKPAVKSMSVAQLRSAISLGEKIKAGDVDLVELDRISLQARGKNEGKYPGKNDEENGTLKKRKRGAADETKTGKDKSPKKQKSSSKDNKSQSTLLFTSADGKDWQGLPSPSTSSPEYAEPKTSGNARRSQLEEELAVTSDLTPQKTMQIFHRIQTNTTLTPFRRRLYTSLLSVPKGQYTTYAALATHLGSAARAVGNGMRNNPFAPDVPCHRVLASDGTLGGFGGEWGKEGKYLPKQDAKIKLLGEEGVKFDSTGKVKGPVWKGFWDAEDFERQYGERVQ